MSRSSWRAGAGRACAIAWVLTAVVIVLPASARAADAGCDQVTGAPAMVRVTAVQATAMSGTVGTAATASDAEAAAQGATLITEPWPGHLSRAGALTAVGDRLFFSATDGTHGKELWISDGTPAGTRMVRDIRPGTRSSKPQALTRFGDRLLFTAYDGTHGRELWVSDGTKAGTRIVRDIRSGSGGALPRGITVVGRIAYLGATEPTHHWGLWRTDGTRAGTRLVHAAGAGRYDSISGITTMGDHIYFVAGTRLWQTDGTSAGTRWLSSSLGPDVAASAIDTAVVGGRLYVSLEGGTTSGCAGVEVSRLVRTDGTRAGTRTIAGGFEPGPIEDLTSFAGRLYFTAVADRGHRRIWVTRGTASTTHLVRPKLFSGEAAGLVAVAGRLYFTTQEGYQLWSTDGSAGGERRIGGGEGWSWLVPGQQEAGVPVHMVSFQGRAWFEAATRWSSPEGDGMHRGDIWSTDGTAAGTRQETTIDPGGSGSVWSLVGFADGLWFAGSVERRDGLWQVDDRTAP